MSLYQHGYFWPSLAAPPYRPLLSAISHISTELLYVGLSWTSCLCSSMWRGPQEYITHEFPPTFPAVSHVSGVCVCVCVCVVCVCVCVCVFMCMRTHVWTTSKDVVFNSEWQLLINYDFPIIHIDPTIYIKVLYKNYLNAGEAII